jgi:hypothetical protein
MSGLVGIVFLTLVTVITNDVPDQLLTVNVALAKRVRPCGPGSGPTQVTVNDVFPVTGTKTVVCAEPGTAEAKISENTETGNRRIFNKHPNASPRFRPT